MSPYIEGVVDPAIKKLREQTGEMKTTIDKQIEQANETANNSAKRLARLEKHKQFQEIAAPLMSFIRQNYDPNTKMIIESDRAELLSIDSGFMYRDL